MIFAEDKKINSKNLVVPHPRYKERRFVLEPLLEIHQNGEFYGKNFQKYIDSVKDQKIEIVDSIMV